MAETILSNQGTWRAATGPAGTALVNGKRRDYPGFCRRPHGLGRRCGIGVPAWLVSLYYAPMFSFRTIASPLQPAARLRRLRVLPTMPWLQASAALLAAALLAGQALAQTVEHTEIARLLQGGQAAQALSLAQRAIEAAPRDPQLQFLKANAELALGQTQAADASLTQLTQTYPELPEPWNNLAVIRAGQGRLDEAQRLLQEALRNNPDYAQAHANLADVLVQQAVQHLHSAQQLAPQASTAQRLQALQQALQATTGSSAPPPAAAPAKP
ncbi:hypothetical protein CLI92_04585 [Vandammella animalimorsus]|uniref:Uncharacterized protein n=2 Tax=Vandammella animalimorsus TaxID=2029117 RepID=A0A2A2T6R5_9BURK|nr:hypothetical protein CK626_01980 [Vandammella animalimorsus]PAX17391.1 hypothetical protein CLI92_04585 [Vandammella animalimorsus]PAX19446.1 hypothetical protein CLI93_07435 [Vandammella animalimorsus]